MSENVSILKFRATPKGYFYGGLDYFKEKVIEHYTESFTNSVISLGDNYIPTDPVMPIMVFMLLEDNTGLIALEYPQSPSHRNAIAEAVRAFVHSPDAILQNNLNISSKIVAVGICIEMWVNSISAEGLSEEEIQNKINHWKDADNNNKISMLSFHFQFIPELARADEYVMYKTSEAGATELFLNTAIQDIISKPTIWSEMFTKKPAEDTRQLEFLSPKKGEEFVSKMIKETLRTNADLQKLEEFTPEEKEKWFEETGQNIPDIDISDAFKPIINPDDDKSEQ